MNNDLLHDSLALIQAAPHQQPPNRRVALQSMLGVGYAVAAMPIMAQTAIKTSGQGLIEGEITIHVDGFQMPAYRAAPAGKHNLPVVLVISEIFGVHEYIADVTRRFAQAGFLAIAPELFVRQGDPSMYGELAKLMSEVIAKVPDAQVMHDLDACVAWANNNGGNVDALYINGFCWGGRITWLYATHNPKLKAGVAWYGRLEGTATPTTPVHPYDVAAQLKAPVLGLYGQADAGIPTASIARMQDKLATLAKQGNAAAQRSRFVLYKDANHAFHADYRASYQEQAAKDGWQQALQWFNAPRRSTHP